MEIICQYPTRKTFASATLISFLLRAALFYFFISPGEFYKQPDSNDYHTGALCVGLGHGMTRPDTKQPMFWRTPGYPYYLSMFYSSAGITKTDFLSNGPAQRASIWLQIFISALIPLLLFALAMLMTNNVWIANCAMWISVFHIGLILASGFLLSEGISLIFFYIFLFFLYKLFVQKPKQWILVCLGAAASLSIHTWIRPMGQWMAIWAACMIIIATHGSWKEACKKSFVFLLPFLLSLAPWYVRNYNYTGEWFFNPTSGPYLNCFSVPKILQRLHGGTIEDACKQAQKAAALEVRKKRMAMHGTGKYVSPLACRAVTDPIIKKYPLWFAYDWMVQVVKTSFDLYSYQLVAIANNSFYYDPAQEFLTEKLADTLWQENVPLATRAIGWLELLFSLSLWIGLLGGLWHFMCKPFWQKTRNVFIKNAHRLWWITFWIIAAPIGMTGGFGYARLRLPVEPLMIILALHFWYWFIYGEK